MDDDLDKEGIHIVKICDEAAAKEYGIEQSPALVYFEHEVLRDARDLLLRARGTQRNSYFQHEVSTGTQGISYFQHEVPTGTQWISYFQHEVRTGTL